MRNRLKYILISIFVFTSSIILQTSLSFAEGDAKVVVSLGDSYSSGEGIEPFYDEAIQYESVDWLAHRSKKAWSGQLMLNGKELKKQKSTPESISFERRGGGDDSFNIKIGSYKKGNWYFVASSGATTSHMKNRHKKSYRKGVATGNNYLPGQLDVFRALEENGQSADYITLTIGGNDVGFSSIIGLGALSSAYLNPTALYAGLKYAWNGFNKETKKDGKRIKPAKIRITQAYRDIHESAGNQAVIFVAGYPELLSEASPAPFNPHDSKLININVKMFNDEIERIVNDLSSDSFKIEYVSVEKEFEGHGAYAWTEKPYLNGLKLNILNQTEDLKDSVVLVGGIPIHSPLPISAYSIHPNKAGAEAYAKCVQDAIEDYEANRLKQTVIDVNSIDREYIQSILAPLSLGYDIGEISKMDKGDVARATSNLIEVSYNYVGAKDSIPYTYVLLGEQGSWNYVKNSDFHKAAECIYGVALSTSDVVDSYQGVSGFMTKEEVNLETADTDLKDDDVSSEDYFFISPIGRGEYSGVIIDDIVSDRGSIKVQYHLEHYDSERSVIGTDPGYTAILEPTGNDRYPFRVLSINLSLEDWREIRNVSVYSKIIKGGINWEQLRRCLELFGEPTESQGIDNYFEENARWAAYIIMDKPEPSYDDDNIHVYYKYDINTVNSIFSGLTNYSFQSNKEIDENTYTNDNYLNLVFTHTDWGVDKVVRNLKGKYNKDTLIVDYDWYKTYRGAEYYLYTLSAVFKRDESGQFKLNTIEQSDKTDPDDIKIHDENEAIQYIKDLYGFEEGGSGDFENVKIGCLRYEDSIYDIRVANYMDDHSSTLMWVWATKEGYVYDAVSEEWIFY